MIEKYTTKTLKKGTQVEIRSTGMGAKVNLVYKKGCCTVTGIEVIYKDNTVEYFSRSDIPTEIILIEI